MKRQGNGRNADDSAWRQHNDPHLNSVIGQPGAEQRPSEHDQLRRHEQTKPRQRIKPYTHAFMTDSGSVPDHRIA